MVLVIVLSRIFAVFLIALAFVVNKKYLEFIAKPDAQAILGTLVLIIIIFGDTITGLLLGILLIVIYGRYYMDLTNNVIKSAKNNKYPMVSLIDPYVTPENLKDAQDNTVLVANAEDEVKGLNGMFDDPVYGAQGFDKTMPGFEPICAPAA
jgi:hypothetical protein